MPLLSTRGAASSKGFGLTAGGAQPVYIEDVFSTYLYTGNGSTQTITNGIDLAGKGGLVWFKNRTQATMHALFDTARGVTNQIRTDGTEGNMVRSNSLASFNATGFTLGADSVGITNATVPYTSWTFRKQPKFFDVVTYTGDGNSERAINHSLNAVPGCVIVKKTNAAQNWTVWHRTFTTGDHMYLNTTGAVVNNTVAFGSNANTSTTFNVGSFLNANGDTYVAYLFAHNAGGFGLSGSDNVISCGSFTTTNGVSGLVNVGYEPQWVLIKRTDSSTLGNWQIYDTMRGAVATNNAGTYDQPAQLLVPNTSDAETTTTGIGVYQQGFNFNNGSGTSTYIYIAIRRGPMKTPTSGTSVFNPVARSGTSATANITAPGFAPDSVWVKSRSNSYGWYDWDKLRGVGAGRLAFNTTDSEQGSSFDIFTAFTNTGYTLGPDTASGQVNTSGSTYINYALQRAPGFFDEVCYTGDSVADRNITHNLAALPQLIIVKPRNLGTQDWTVLYYSSASSRINGVLNGAFTFNGPYTNWTVTNSTFVVNGSNNMNGSGNTYVAYLFATCPGVSKVGSYTGTGTTKQIDCGFTGGARFVLIKRTDSTGDWYVWDSARGIVAGNDPYLLLNSTAAEVTNTDYIDTYSAGFEISSTAPAAINANGGTFIFLAIA
jgi:hypothetical protein